MIKPEKFSTSKATNIWVPVVKARTIDISTLNPEYKTEMLERDEILSATPAELKAAGWDLKTAPIAEMANEVYHVAEFCITAAAHLTQQRDVLLQSEQEAKDLASHARAELEAKYGAMLSTNLDDSSHAQSSGPLDAYNSFFPQGGGDNEDFSDKLKLMRNRKRGGGHPPESLDY